jgi:hypothetical protein
MGCTAAFAILRPIPSAGLTPVFGPIDSSSPQSRIAKSTDGLSLCARMPCHVSASRRRDAGTFHADGYFCVSRTMPSTLPQEDFRNIAHNFLWFPP